MLRHISRTASQFSPFAPRNNEGALPRHENADENAPLLAPVPSGAVDSTAVTALPSLSAPALALVPRSWQTPPSQETALMLTALALSATAGGLVLAHVPPLWGGILLVGGAAAFSAAINHTAWQRTSRLQRQLTQQQSDVHAARAAQLSTQQHLGAALRERDGLRAQLKNAHSQFAEREAALEEATQAIGSYREQLAAEQEAFAKSITSSLASRFSKPRWGSPMTAQSSLDTRADDLDEAERSLAKRQTALDNQSRAAQHLLNKARLANDEADERLTEAKRESQSIHQHALDRARKTAVEARAESLAARETSEQIVAEAHAQADAIIEAAKRKAAQAHTKVQHR